MLVMHIGADRRLIGEAECPEEYSCKGQEEKKAVS